MERISTDSTQMKDSKTLFKKRMSCCFWITVLIAILLFILGIAMLLMIRTSPEDRSSGDDQKYLSWSAWIVLGWIPLGFSIVLLVFLTIYYKTK
jgi:uncharacterized BrkB/YihY/UPF0761 family membrane protein